MSLGQRYSFGGSTGAWRHCLGTPDLLEQVNNAPRKSYEKFSDGTEKVYSDDEVGNPP